MQPIITLDIDWAPDFIIDWCANHLEKSNVKSTWFVTHEHGSLQHMRERSDIFELGIHPNCFPNSTQGETEDEILAFVKELVPEAVTMRTHGLYQSSNFLHKASSQYGVKIDCSIYLPRTKNIEPHIVKWQNINLLRVPHFWADGTEKFDENPIWDLKHEVWKNEGLQVLDFHPVHIYLNSIDPKVYRKLVTDKPLPEWTEDYVAPYINHGKGPQTLFLELIDHLKDRESVYIKDLLKP